MKVDVRQSSLQDADAALVAVGLYEGDSLPDGVAEAPGAGDAKGSFKTLTRLYPGGPERLLVVGLGEREDFEVEKLRVLAALVAGEAAKLEATSLAWALPAAEDEAAAAEAIVTGTILGSYRFDRFKGRGEDDEPGPAPGDADRARPGGARRRGRDRPDLLRGRQPRPRPAGDARQLQPPRGSRHPRRGDRRGLRQGHGRESSTARRSAPKEWAASPPSARAARSTRA